TIFCTKCFTLRFLPTEVCEQAVEEECCEDSALTEPPWQPLTSDPVKSKSRDCLLWLVDLQRADGSWILNSELCSCLNVSESAVHSALPKTWNGACPKGPVPETAWATALALAYFETALATRESEWKLLARKANSWLVKQVPVGSGSTNNSKKYCDNLIAMAKQFLQACKT
ncbi:hypothetical protein FBUS_07216, partial [Fasciolopsis buskii]